MRNWRQQIRFLFGDATLILVVLGFLVLINFLSYRHFLRFDLTENRIYTLSESSRRIVSRLEDPVTIQCFFSKKAPPELGVLRQQISDLLEEYRVSGKGKIRVIFSDPAEDPLLQKRVELMGVQQVQMNVYQKDQAQITNVFMGIVLSYEDRQEILPFVKEAKNLEYDVSSAILRLLRNQKKRVVFLTGGGEYDLNENFGTVREILEPLYDLTRLDPAAAGAVPEGTDLLIVVSPEPVTERMKFAIDRYVMQGGKVFFLIDRVNIDGGTMTASRRDCNWRIHRLLRRETDPDLVLVRFNLAINFRRAIRYSRFPMPSIRSGEGGFRDGQPIVNRLDAPVFHGRALDVTNARVKSTILARSCPCGFSGECTTQSRPDSSPQGRSNLPPGGVLEGIRQFLSFAVRRGCFGRVPGSAGGWSTRPESKGYEDSGYGKCPLPVRRVYFRPGECRFLPERRRLVHLGG